MFKTILKQCNCVAPGKVIQTPVSMNGANYISCDLVNEGLHLAMVVKLN